MVVIDGVQELVDLIKNQWNSVNTDTVTPNIGKITDYPFDLQFGDGKGFILLYSQNESEDMPGLGLPLNSNITESVRIDIRTFDNEEYFKKVKAELKRILYTYRVQGTDNYTCLNLDNQSIQNLSNRMKRVFREVRDVELQAYNRDMTA